ncbi:RluA family pseudouridine synthase [uncultured Dialister sp.]|jgi:23S rRNA pseudouridine1911/1915/1917 synthase|uniref:RluA family pseudouridine synthase n=1 Tax=uncultured Dialister sp. TaxID=278064 RepID=UPI0025F304ED|nr:RluA family pseudouridine synthase [uncultured Dialister sp.]
MELQYVVTEKHDGQQLKGFVKGRRELSSSLWKRIKWTGETLVNGAPVHNARMVLHAGDTIIFRWSEDNDIVPSNIPLSIIYEDKDILIVNKGPGMIIHPTSREAHDTLVNAVAGYFHRSGEDAGIHPVYRLDRNTTGLVVVAKSALGQYGLSKSHDSIYREYLALVEGKVEPSEGSIIRPIGRKPGSIVEWMVREDGKWAGTEYRVLAVSPEVSLLRIHLLSGRTHQIRVHFSSLGHPLLGDDLYGGSLALISRQALHAFSLSFIHPLTGESMHFTAPVPEDMSSLIRSIWGTLDMIKEDRKND